MVEEFVAYIDEAGDEGIGKLRAANSGQSRWLILGGILVRKRNDIALPKWRDDLLNLFPKKKKREIHFRDLKHDQKVAAVSQLATRPLGICCVCSHKVTLLDGGRYEALYSRKGHLYNYLTRFLLERLTAAVQGTRSPQSPNPKLSVVFSRRAGTDYHAMREYLELQRDGGEVKRPVRNIAWDVFDPADIRVENHSLWAGLQLADVVTSATFSALEPNLYGHHEPRYALALGDKFLKSRGSVLNCGLTLVPSIDRCQISEDQRIFVNELIKG